jgi:glycosyltransferase involved in cell wall biosynthesis
MKILHLLGDLHLPRNPDNEGASGVVRAALEIARAQVRLGHSVHVAAIGHDAWQCEWEGVRLMRLEMAPWARLNVDRRVFDFRRHLPYMALTSRRTFDVVHGHIYSYMRFLRAKQRIVHLHNDFSLEPADLDTIRRNSSAQVAVSQFVARQLERSLGGSGQVHVVYNGVDTTCFDSRRHQQRAAELRRQWGVEDGDVAFLFAGAIVPEKGVIHFARAFARLSETNTRAHLVLAGSSELWRGTMKQGRKRTSYEDDVNEVLRKPLQNHRAHLLGKVASLQMPAVYTASDVVVVPSTCREGFGLVALEAMASERAVIASNSGGLAELVDGQNGIPVPPGDEIALESAMRTLANDTGLRSVLGKAGGQKSRQFSWDIAARQLDAIYRGIAVEQPRRL